MNNQNFIINPSVLIKSKEKDTFITVPHMRKKIQASRSINKVLKIIEEPMDLLTIEKLGVKNQVIEFLLGETILIPENEVKLHKNGLIKQPKNTIGKKLDIYKIATDANFKKKFCFLGIPVSYEVKGFYSPMFGTSQIRSNIRLFENLNQEYIRDLNYYKTYIGNEVLPFDLGDISYDSRIESISDINEKVDFVVKKMSKHNLKPIILGGDHTITYPVVSALMDVHKNLTIIHFDAHTDRYENRLRNMQGLTIGNVFSELMKNENFHQLVQVGIREYEKKEHIYDSFDKRVKVYSANKIHSLNDITSIFSTLDKSDPIYISFDVDVLDPSFAPEVAWPVIGGLTYHQTATMIEYLSNEFNIVGADFVEVCNGDRTLNLAALSAANLATLITLNQNKKEVKHYDNKK